MLGMSYGQTSPKQKVYELHNAMNVRSKSLFIVRTRSVSYKNGLVTVDKSHDLTENQVYNTTITWQTLFT